MKAEYFKIQSAILKAKTVTENDEDFKKLVELQAKFNDLFVYTERIDDPDYDVYTVADFKEAIKEGSFNDYDGYGSPAKNGFMENSFLDGKIYPSEVDRIPFDATHIVWFNK